MLVSVLQPIRRIGNVNVGFPDVT